MTYSKSSSAESKRMRMTLQSVTSFYNNRYEQETNTSSNFNKEDSIDISNQASPLYEQLKRKRKRNEIDSNGKENMGFITTPSFRKQLFKEKFKYYCKYGGDLLELLEIPLDSNSSQPYRYTIEWLREYSRSLDSYQESLIRNLINHLLNLENAYISNKPEIDKYTVTIVDSKPVLSRWNGKCVQCDSCHSGYCN